MSNKVSSEINDRNESIISSNAHCAAGDTDDGLSPAGGLLDQAQAMLEQEQYADSLALLEPLTGTHLTSMAQMRYCYLKGWALLNLQQLEVAYLELAHALKLASQLKAVSCAAYIHYRLGVAHYRRNQFAEAEHYFLRTWLALQDREIDDPKLKVQVDLSLGNATLRQGRFKNAIGHYHDALGDETQLLGGKWLGSIYWGLGLAYLYRREFGVAKVEIGAALGIQQQGAADSFLAMVNAMYGMILIELNQPEAALKELRHTVYLSKQVGDHSALVLTYGNIAEAYLACEQLPEALTAAQQAVAQAHELGVGPLHIAQVQLILAKVHASRGEYEQADVVFAEAETLISKSGDKVKHMELLHDYGKALLKWGNYARAIKKLTLACHLRNPMWRYLMGFDE
jgi:tetratricopeptide (TPR) repeat protein